MKNNLLNPNLKWDVYDEQTRLHFNDKPEHKTLNHTFVNFILKYTMHNFYYSWSNMTHGSEAVDSKRIQAAGKES